MSILLREGFGNLSDGTHTAGTTKEILGSQWASFAANFKIEDRADGRKWLTTPSTSAVNVNLQSGAFAAQTTVRMAFRVIRTSATDAVRLLDALASDAYTAIRIGINSTGQVTAYRSTTIVATSTISVPLDTETHIEAVVLLKTDTTGTVQFYVNGVDAGLTTGVQTSLRTAATTLLLGYGLPGSWELGDIVVHTGSSPLGDVGVYYKPVDGDEGTPDFTPSAVGANTLMLDEIGPDEDTTYNESDGTAGHRDQFSAAGLTGMTILEVCSLVRARKTSTGTATLLLGMKENLTEDQSAAKALSEDFMTLIEGWETNPDTSAAWTAQQAIDALISYEVGA